MEESEFSSRLLTRARARHDVARLLGAGGLALLAQFAVDMPHGYFGPTDTVTTFGWLFAGWTCALLISSAVVYEHGWRWASLLGRGILGFNIGVFVPALPGNPVIAGGVVLWNLVLLTQSFVPAPPGALLRHRRKRFGKADPQEIWLAVNGRAAIHLTMVALLLTLLVMGFRIGHRTPAQLICGVFDLLALAFSAPYLLGLLRRRRRRILVAAAVLIATLVSLPRPSVALTVFAGFLVVLLVSLAGTRQTTRDLIHHFVNHPAALVATSFIVLILAGTIFLSVPAASGTSQPIGTLDALFTATSASCVTGLIVLDTPHDFSFTGQLIILLLIQVGGLSIMVLSMFAALMLGRDLGWQGERLMSELFDLERMGDAVRMTAFVVIATLTCELVGAVFLGWGYLQHGLSPLQAVWRAVFHSISAFCNAGFALQTDSVMMFRQDPWMLTAFAVLIILGGLGFVVLAWLWSRLRGQRQVGFGLQARLVLIMSGALLLFGTAFIAALEWNRSLADVTWGHKLVNAFFQSATLRTAGFNSVDLSVLHPAVVLLMMMLMFVGASPGSTGGGIKTTTAAVLLGAIPALARRKPEIIFHGRRVALDTIYRSAAIAVVGGGIVLGGSWLLLVSQGQDPGALIFEAFSAFGTVGLSLGATGQLDGAGKIVIILLMFAGRVGPLTLAILLGSRREGLIGYPEARIMVG